jgi:antitoxin MazE
MIRLDYGPQIDHRIDIGIPGFCGERLGVDASCMIYVRRRCISLRGAMQVAKWGNSLAVRLPQAIVEALKLQEGDEVQIEVVGSRAFEVERKPAPRELLARLRKYRGRLPATFVFDRLEANERR